MLQLSRNARRAALLALSVFAVAACSDDTDDHEVEVDFMRITAGAQQLMVNSTGAVTGGPLALQAGVGRAITVDFLKADMTTDALGDEAGEFQVAVTVPAGVTFTRTGPFAGTLTASAAGSYDVSFALLHVEENHEDFGPFPVAVSVSAAAVAVQR